MGLAMADACAAPYERALTLLAQAELAFAGGRRRAALDLLEGVRATCSMLGAAPMLARVADLAARGAPASRLGKAHPAGLTGREIEVVRLIAVGLSNTEIGARLCLSLPTVKNHVAHVLAKTDSRNRAAAAAFALREGLT
jgi:DNA-binding NarL/FixJ family response regulator